jgi:hypothetical protein
VCANIWPGGKVAKFIVMTGRRASLSLYRSIFLGLSLPNRGLKKRRGKITDQKCYQRGKNYF